MSAYYIPATWSPVKAPICEDASFHMEDISVNALILTDWERAQRQGMGPPSFPLRTPSGSPWASPTGKLARTDSRQAPPPPVHPTRSRPSAGPALSTGPLSAFRHAPIWPRGFWEMSANSHQVHELTLSKHYNPRTAPHATGTSLPRPAPPGHAHRCPGYVGEGNPDVQLPGDCQAPPSAASWAAGLSSTP